jgi:hypothetical protein
MVALLYLGQNWPLTNCVVVKRDIYVRITFRGQRPWTQEHWIEQQSVSETLSHSHLVITRPDSEEPNTWWECGLPSIYATMREEKEQWRKEVKEIHETTFSSILLMCDETIFSSTLLMCSVIVFWHRGYQVLLKTSLQEKRKWEAVSHTRQD